MGQKKKYRNIALGIIIDTALKIPPDTGVTYRLYYLSKKLAQNGMNVKIFLSDIGKESLEREMTKGPDVWEGL